MAKSLRALFSVLLFVLFLLPFTSCGGNEDKLIVHVESVSLNKASIVLTEGMSERLSVTVLPTNASNKNVSWKSSNDAVATVWNGEVKAIGIGNATITVTTEDGAKSATCSVSVEPSLVPVTGLTFDKSSLEIIKGESADIIATVIPSNASDKAVYWGSSNEKIVTVEAGKVTAMEGGSAIISAKTQDGGFLAECYVTVKVPVTNVAINKSSLTMTEGETQRLVASISPADATNKNVSWESSNTEVATVSLGVVTAIKPGTATIKVTTEDGNKTGTCDITVMERTYPVTGVSLDKTSISMVKGESTSLTATISPSNATNKNVTWTSSNTSVATVNNGSISAVGGGSATITVKTQDGEFTATCSISVTVPVSSVKLDKYSLSLIEGESRTLIATVNPFDATNKNVSWESSDTEVATVKDGKVTAVKPGNTTITVTTEDGSKTASCEVSVKAKVYSVTGVSLDKTSISMVKGDSETLTATISPSNATNKNVTWTSSNTAVATVNNGTVSAVGGGSATITVKTQDGGFIATCAVNVTVPVTSVKLDKSSLSLTEGESTTLIATVSPSDATNKNVSWESSNTEVATVKGGKVTAVKPGTSTITVTTEDGSKTATCEVSVKAKVYPVTGVSLDKTSISMVKGETASLSATVSPSNATNKTITWTSSNTAVATVDDGTVSAVGGGSATITVKTQDGGFTATCEISVFSPVTGITLDKTSETLRAGQSVTLTATVNPSDATDNTVTWSTSDASVATVKNGVVKALKVGTATITAAAGEMSAECEITVEPTPVTGISLNKTSHTMFEGQILTLVATVTPRDATDKTVTWSSSDESIATVSDGIVKALVPGSVTITATCSGFEATCTVTVKQVDVLSLSVDAIEVGSNGGTTDITITSNISWEISSDSSWCTISPTSGSGNGSFMITTSRNMTNGKRVATVTVIGNGETDLINRKVTVTQLKDTDNGIGSGDWENRGED